MEVRPGYRQTEVGVIPEDWAVRPLGSFCEISAGRDLVKEDFSPGSDQRHEFPIYSNALTNEGLYGYSKSYQFAPDKITVTARGDVGHAVYRSTRFCAIGRLLVLSSTYPCDLRFVTEWENLIAAYASVADRTVCFLNSGETPEIVFTQQSEHREVIQPVIMQLLQSRGLT